MKYKTVDMCYNAVIKLGEDIHVCVYDSNNISIVQYHGTKNNRQIAYFNAKERQWYVPDDKDTQTGACATIPLTKT